ncbi:hypothetical protein O6H91_Y355000 [Diphasiastrum complanatum]|nr:hypothetical protein O6H91_Y355000 [Diphasiastrum complanatum]
MPRPGPRPYECIRRAWHSEGHQPLRGTITQEILRVVTELHKPETRRKKEWQEKLPVVVLRAEEILYSKARSEENYIDLSTLRERLEDAVDTMIRRTDNSKDAPFMQPCVEAALFLGCSKKNPKGLRLGGARYAAEASKPFVPACAAAAGYVDAAFPRNLDSFPYGIAQDLYKAYNGINIKNFDSFLQPKSPDIVSRRVHPPNPSTISLPLKIASANLQVEPLDSFTKISPGVQLRKAFPVCHSYETVPSKMHQTASYGFQPTVKSAHFSEVECALSPGLQSCFNSTANHFTDTNLIAACRSSIAALRLDLNSRSSASGHGEEDELQLRLAPPGSFVGTPESDGMENGVTSLSRQQASAVCCARPLANFIATDACQYEADNNPRGGSGSRRRFLIFDEFCVPPKTIGASTIDLNSLMPKKPRLTVPF